MNKAKIILSAEAGRCPYWDTENNCPAADVVPVVRCEDCEHWNKVVKTIGYCKAEYGFGRWWRKNDFCSYGERKE